MRKSYENIFILAGFILFAASCTKLPADLTEEDRVNALDEQGLIVDWKKTYGGSGNDYFVNFDKTSDGGYIFVGSTSSYGAGLNDVYLLKTDANGSMEWYKTFGGTDYDNGTYVQQAVDGGYIIVGDTRMNFGYSADIYLIKTDNLGNKTWERTYGKYYSDFCKYVQQTEDGGYLLIGALRDPGTVGYYLKVNAVGDTVWSKETGFVPIAAKMTSSGAYVIATSTALLKIDNNGNYIWEAAVSCNSVAQSPDNSYYAINGNKIYRILDDGAISWSKTYVDSTQYYGKAIALANDGCFIITGSRSDIVTDLFMAKVDPSGKLLYKFIFNDAGEGCCVMQNQDGSFAIGGTTNNLISSTYSRDALIIKTKPENNWR